MNIDQLNQALKLLYAEYKKYDAKFRETQVSDFELVYHANEENLKQLVGLVQSTREEAELALTNLTNNEETSSDNQKYIDYNNLLDQFKVLAENFQGLVQEIEARNSIINTNGIGELNNQIRELKIQNKRLVFDVDGELEALKNRLHDEYKEHQSYIDGLIKKGNRILLRNKKHLNEYSDDPLEFFAMGHESLADTSDAREFAELKSDAERQISYFETIQKHFQPVTEALNRLKTPVLESEMANEYVNASIQTNSSGFDEVNLSNLALAKVKFEESKNIIEGKIKTFSVVNDEIKLFDKISEKLKDETKSTSKKVSELRGKLSVIEAASRVRTDASNRDEFDKVYVQSMAKLAECQNNINELRKEVEATKDSELIKCLDEMVFHTIQRSKDILEEKYSAFHNLPNEYKKLQERFTEQKTRWKSVKGSIKGAIDSIEERNEPISSLMEKRLANFIDAVEFLKISESITDGNNFLKSTRNLRNFFKADPKTLKSEIQKCITTFVDNLNTWGEIAERNGADPSITYALSVLKGEADNLWKFLDYQVDNLWQDYNYNDRLQDAKVKLIDLSEKTPLSKMFNDITKNFHEWKKIQADTTTSMPDQAELNNKLKQIETKIDKTAVDIKKSADFIEDSMALAGVEDTEANNFKFVFPTLRETFDNLIKLRNEEEKMLAEEEAKRRAEKEKQLVAKRLASEQLAAETAEELAAEPAEKLDEEAQKVVETAPNFKAEEVEEAEECEEELLLGPDLLGQPDPDLLAVEENRRDEVAKEEEEAAKLRAKEEAKEEEEAAKLRAKEEAKLRAEEEETEEHVVNDNKNEVHEEITTSTEKVEVHVASKQPVEETKPVVKPVVKSARKEKTRKEREIERYKNLLEEQKKKTAAYLEEKRKFEAEKALKAAEEKKLAEEEAQRKAKEEEEAAKLRAEEEAKLKAEEKKLADLELIRASKVTVTAVKVENTISTVNPVLSKEPEVESELAGSTKEENPAPDVKSPISLTPISAETKTVEQPTPIAIVEREFKMQLATEAATEPKEEQRRLQTRVESTPELTKLGQSYVITTPETSQVPVSYTPSYETFVHVAKNTVDVLKKDCVFTTPTTSQVPKQFAITTSLTQVPKQAITVPLTPVSEEPKAADPVAEPKAEEPKAADPVAKPKAEESEAEESGVKSPIRLEPISAETKTVEQPTPIAIVEREFKMQLATEAATEPKEEQRRLQTRVESTPELTKLGQSYVITTPETSQVPVSYTPSYETFVHVAKNTVDVLKKDCVLTTPTTSQVPKQFAITTSLTQVPKHAITVPLTPVSEEPKAADTVVAKAKAEEPTDPVVAKAEEPKAADTVVAKAKAEEPTDPVVAKAEEPKAADTVVAKPKAESKADPVAKPKAVVEADLGDVVDNATAEPRVVENKTETKAVTAEDRVASGARKKKTAQQIIKEIKDKLEPEGKWAKVKKWVLSFSKFTKQKEDAFEVLYNDLREAEKNAPGSEVTVSQVFHKWKYTLSDDEKRVNKEVIMEKRGLSFSFFKYSETKSLSVINKVDLDNWDWYIGKADEQQKQQGVEQTEPPKKGVAPK